MTDPVPSKDRFTPEYIAEVVNQLESQGWRPDSRGDPECCDEASAAGAQIIEHQRAEIERLQRLLNKADIERSWAIGQLKEATIPRPIESAPKDMKDFVGWERGAPGIYYRTDDTPDDAAISYGTACYPTHWLPLPLVNLNGASRAAQPPRDSWDANGSAVIDSCIMQWSTEACPGCGATTDGGIRIHAPGCTWFYGACSETALR